ncbi:serine/arginine-rich splicing factor RS2Z32-like [Morus notabilis]|uniref:serine/arginine-rich splicing factor RS2Z32-like n=1 Tax=Morus notabilis TaxID=981085 RepID=UPI000CED292B|nr:serine/arginine-rich splicing factor RS2Z32-like [Morus notabilis]
MGVPDEYWVEFAAFKFEGPAAAISVKQEHVAFLQSREISGRTLGGPQRSNRKSRDQGQGNGGVPSGSSDSLGSGNSGPYSFKCHHCGELGHIKRNCPLKSQQVNRQTQQSPQSQRGVAPSQEDSHSSRLFISPSCLLISA